MTEEQTVKCTMCSCELVAHEVFEVKGRPFCFECKSKYLIICLFPLPDVKIDKGVYSTDFVEFAKNSRKNNMVNIGIIIQEFLEGSCRQEMTVRLKEPKWTCVFNRQVGSLHSKITVIRELIKTWQGPVSNVLLAGHGDKEVFFLSKSADIPLAFFPVKKALEFIENSFQVATWNELTEIIATKEIEEKMKRGISVKNIIF